MTKSETEKLLDEIKYKCEQGLRGPTRYQEHYTGILREIRDDIAKAQEGKK